ncbi:MAG: hypothetical protein AAF467_01820 [Actinomycetota bacterium]
MHPSLRLAPERGHLAGPKARRLAGVMVALIALMLALPSAASATTTVDDATEAGSDVAAVASVGDGGSATTATALNGAPSPRAALLVDGGATLVVASATNRTLVEFRLGTPGDLSTATVVADGGTFDVADRAGDVRAMAAGADGTTLLVATSAGEVHEFRRAGSIGSLTFVRTVVLGAGVAIDELIFAPDGSAVHTLDAATGTIRSYRLGQPYDLASVDPLAVASQLGVSGIVALVPNATFSSMTAVIGGSASQRQAYRLGVPGDPGSGQPDGSPVAIAQVTGTVHDAVLGADGTLWVLFDGPDSTDASIQAASTTASIPAPEGDESEAPRIEVAGVVVVAEASAAAVSPTADGQAVTPAAAVTAAPVVAEAPTTSTEQARTPVIATPSLSSELPGYTGASAGSAGAAATGASESFVAAAWLEAQRQAGADAAALPFFDRSGSLFGLPPIDELAPGEAPMESDVALGEPVTVLGSEAVDDDSVNPAGLLAALGVIVIVLGGAAFVVTRDQRWS